MILLGIDDTDTADTEGTNQLARRIARRLPAGCAARAILRHQLFFDPRVPYTSKNGSASLLVDGPDELQAAVLEAARAVLRDRFVPGSDPGLCILSHARVPGEVTGFARRCQTTVVATAEANDIAARHQLSLEALGGTGDGVIGALAAVGLAATGEDGRVVELAGWPWPDPFAGLQTTEAIRARGIADIRDHDTGAPVARGLIDVGKHLRPAWRGGRAVLFVRAVEPAGWQALKLP